MLRFLKSNLLLHTMTSLIACLGAGKGTWVPVLQLIDAAPWDSVFLVMPAFFADKYQPKSEKVQKIVIDDTKELPALTQDITKALDGKLFGEVAVNFTSGEGKEHMALLAALLKIGCGVRLVTMQENSMQEL